MPERTVCQRSSNHKLKAIHNEHVDNLKYDPGVSKIVKSQIESNSQPKCAKGKARQWCVKDRQITNWKQFTTPSVEKAPSSAVCQRSSNHKLKAIHNVFCKFLFCDFGVSKIVKSQIESNSQLCHRCHQWISWCVKDRQITNWKQFTTILR